MAKLLHLLLAIAFTSAQLDFEDDEPEYPWDNSLTRDVERTLFGEDARTITIFSDFNNPSDQLFFQTILPWIVDNIGNYLHINYRFRNSARSSGPRACALRALRRNTYSQAELLRCEARGNPLTNCVNQAPIERRQYNRCVNRRVNAHVRKSQWDFDRLISNRTPIILVNGRREIAADDPVRLLRLICQSYGRQRPVGCLRALPIPIPTVARPSRANIRDLSEQNASAAEMNPVAVSNSDASAAETESLAMPYHDLGSSTASVFHQPTTLQLSLLVLSTKLLSGLIL